MLEFKTYRTWAIASGYRDNSLKKKKLVFYLLTGADYFF